MALFAWKIVKEKGGGGKNEFKTSDQKDSGGKSMGVKGRGRRLETQT